MKIGRDECGLVFARVLLESPNAEGGINTTPAIRM